MREAMNVYNLLEGKHKMNREAEIELDIGRQY